MERIVETAAAALAKIAVKHDQHKTEKKRPRTSS